MYLTLMSIFLDNSQILRNFWTAKKWTTSEEAKRRSRYLSSWRWEDHSGCWSKRKSCLLVPGTDMGDERALGTIRI